MARQLYVLNISSILDKEAPWYDYLLVRPMLLAPWVAKNLFFNQKDVINGDVRIVTFLILVIRKYRCAV